MRPQNRDFWLLVGSIIFLVIGIVAFVGAAHQFVEPGPGRWRSIVWLLAGFGAQLAFTTWNCVRIWKAVLKRRSP